MNSFPWKNSGHFQIFLHVHCMSNETMTYITMRLNLHLFSMNWCRRQDFPVPALPITRNLNRKSESRGDELEINATGIPGGDPQISS